MSIRRMIPALTLTAALALGQAGLAQEADPPTQPAQEPAQAAAQETAQGETPGAAQAAASDVGLTLADLGKDEGLTAAVEKMAEGHQMPEWLREGAVISPSQKVGFGGQEYLAMTACKQHDCAANQFAVLYAPGSGTAHGVLSVRDGEGAELLTWLGMAGGPETIDGRTILYAALTGSLANHPQDFTYAE
ncbi:Ivy family c-type lysozyme inhibitor [Paracoccus denitrificans]|jgi:hypothetical protein|uniref:C-lysozyme inhibitor n=1 Tax=Paracoccus denitrificans (strain Pd 1222) TaxID=318586 RepID=A1B846_PARDP|nr:Ivy family c-type lysozyme inhibitor [Paracoccus denitrificans]ABL71690.1 hypothetical protein Pden_3623 [Paracoccus denitrificans PD1222]MBB4629361.1 hypothetical protein [Paracoccus denitrificans]MCU7430494.1 Ivy family c-type lysozyme inhibitor [Paracoccus denitrificans]QAR28280.1 C-lysozyme inhibitor [Paracoccus denitrificans]UPV98019.1 Ivy family c-type lysozyme inhibitor [Paracoccus denitrificans]